MRKFLMTTFVFSLCVMPLTACEVEEDCAEGEVCDGDTDATDATEPTTDPTDATDATDVTPTLSYHAILVEDANEVNACESPNTQAEGFDLDAVQLSDADDLLIGYGDVVVAGAGIAGDTGCGYDNGHPDVAEAKGAPDGDKDTGYVALNTSAVGVEIGPNSPQLNAGDVITVYETACSVCGDEPYILGIAKDAACVNDVNAAECATVVLGNGNGTSSLAVGW